MNRTTPKLLETGTTKKKRKKNKIHKTKPREKKNRKVAEF
jgi:hypothetical protein